MRLSAFGKEPIDTQQHVSTVLPIMVRVRAVVRLDMHQVRAQFRQVEVEAIGMQSLDEVASLEDLEEEARLEWQSACTQKAISMQSVWRAACTHEAVACRHRLHAACTHEAVAVGRRVERANVIRPVEHCVGAELARRRFPRHLGRLTDTSWRRRRRDGTQAGREPSTDSLDDRD